MTDNTGTFDSSACKEATLNKVLSIMASLGVTKTYIKKLAPNDNSKNQPYFGGHLTDLAFIPSGELIPSQSTSGKTKDPKRQIKYTTNLNFTWFDADGATYDAPNAKLIYYPQYPEVRFSGFLQGSRAKAGEWMDPYKQGRSEGRWLILGVHPDEKAFGYLVTPECNLARELENTTLQDIGSVFGQVDMAMPSATKKQSSREALIAKLREIHEMGWVSSRRLTAEMEVIEYKALNGGGYTLEALLGISPNGFAEPDYLGWEVKQFGVKKLPRIGAKPTTLMTPEPDGGFYKDVGVIEFVHRYGYADVSGIADRYNFGGKHLVGKLQDRTNLTLSLLGYNANEGKIEDAAGKIALLDVDENITASWSFAKLMDHWKRKHSQAVYIPSLKRKEAGEYQYHYGKDIELGTGTNIEMMLQRMHDGFVFYDPGIKVEHASSDKPKTKRRNQFRINHKQLEQLYQKFEFTDVLDV
jgi:hypothetical protein